jgi:hypothetical protein
MPAEAWAGSHLASRQDFSPLFRLAREFILARRGRLRSVAAVCVVACARLSLLPGASGSIFADGTGQGNVTIMNMRLLPPVALRADRL